LIDACYEYAGADDDPLPGIEGLRITGEAFLGRELLASGYPINGTTTCNFEVFFKFLSIHILNSEINVLAYLKL